VDDYLIESMSGTNLKLHTPLPAGKGDCLRQALGRNTSAYVTVLKDGDRYRMYYAAGEFGPALCAPGCTQTR